MRSSHLVKRKGSLISIIDSLALFIVLFLFKTTFRRLDLYLHPQVESLFSFTTVERQLSELFSDNLFRIIGLNSYPRKKKHYYDKHQRTFKTGET